jgi:hypothetical protein
MVKTKYDVQLRQNKMITIWSYDIPEATKIAEEDHPGWEVYDCVPSENQSWVSNGN